MKAQVTWTGPGLRMIGEAEDGPAIVVDSKGGTYGTHSGPTPMELLLMGLAGCTAMDVVSIMEKKRQPLTSLQVKVNAERADDHPRYFTKIELAYTAYGEGVDEDALARAIDLSENKYCSAQAMFRDKAELTHTYRVVTDAVAPSKPGTLPQAES